MAEKIDLTREFKSDYSAKPAPEVKSIATAQYLAVPGQGAPMGDLFNASMQALYAVAYGIKMSSKKDGNDFKVNPLEGLWWVTSEQPYLDVPREEWHWKLLIRMPDLVSKDDLEQAKESVIAKKGLPQAQDIKLETLDEGLCVQALHVGPYSAEPATLAKMKSLMESEGYEVNGNHHEIYLSDPRKAASERMKTILRQPVKSS